MNFEKEGRRGKTDPPLVPIKKGKRPFFSSSLIGGIRQSQGG